MHKCTAVQRLIRLKVLLKKAHQKQWTVIHAQSMCSRKRTYWLASGNSQPSYILAFAVLVTSSKAGYLVVWKLFSEKGKMNEDLVVRCLYTKFMSRTKHKKITEEGTSDQCGTMRCIQNLQFWMISLKIPSFFILILFWQWTLNVVCKNIQIRGTQTFYQYLPRNWLFPFP